MSDAARASVNVNLSQQLLPRIAAKVGAPRSLTVHRLADLGGGSQALDDARTPGEIEAKVSQVLAVCRNAEADEMSLAVAFSSLTSVHDVVSVLCSTGMMAVPDPCQ